MEKEHLKITNQRQFEKLVEELEKSPSFAKGFRRGTVPSNYKEQWDNIATALNALGPPRRSGVGWQKVWRDLKFKVKKKFIATRTLIKVNESSKYYPVILSPLEKSVSKLLNFEKHINLNDTIHEIKCEDQEDISEAAKVLEDISDTEDLNITIIQKSSENIGLDLPYASNSRSNGKSTLSQRKETPNMDTNSSNYYEMLERHSNKHATLLTNIMSSVKRSLQDMSKYQNELLKFEAKKLKLAEERNEREKEMHEIDLKIQTMELAIKERKLQLLNDKIKNK